jgi:phenylacetate-CoA ligase
MEFVDNEGDNVSAGEQGEIVYTSLFNYSIPLIRYAVGDIGVPSDHRCSCGSVLPLMKNIVGRTDSLLRLPSGRLLSPRIFSGAIDGFELFEEIDEYKLVQKRADLLKLFVVRRSSMISEDVFRNKLVKYLANLVGFNPDEIKLDVEFCDQINVGIGGKHRAIISEVKI